MSQTHRKSKGKKEKVGSNRSVDKNFKTQSSSVDQKHDESTNRRKREICSDDDDDKSTKRQQLSHVPNSTDQCNTMQGLEETSKLVTTESNTTATFTSTSVSDSHDELKPEDSSLSK